MAETKEIEKFIQHLQKEIETTEGDYLKADAIERLKEAAASYYGEDKVISSHDLYESIKNRPPEKGIFTGYKDIDDILGGFRKKQLVVISAATKSGKTSFCIEITSRIKEESPLWLPFEEPAEELIMKFHERGEQPPLFYTPEKMTGNTMLWIEKKIVESKAKYGTNVVFIDHLHFIIQLKSERLDTDIGITMRELKRIAKQWDVVIVLIAHMKKSKMEIRPELEDLRDSSFIAQEADTVIMLWRETKKEKGDIIITNNVNVSIQANRRNGKTGNVKMIFQNGRFILDDWTKRDEDENKHGQDNDKEW